MPKLRVGEGSSCYWKDEVEADRDFGFSFEAKIRLPRLLYATSTRPSSDASITLPCSTFALVDFLKVMDDEFDEPRAKRLKVDSQSESAEHAETDIDDGESTEYKLAVLASLHPDKSADVLMDYVLAYGGSVEKASQALSGGDTAKRKRGLAAALGYRMHTVINVEYAFQVMC